MRDSGPPFLFSLGNTVMSGMLSPVQGVVLINSPKKVQEVPAKGSMVPKKKKPKIGGNHTSSAVNRSGLEENESR